MTDEEGRTVGPGTPGVAGGPVPGGPAQGAGGLASLMSGRSTFGGNKRRRTTSTGHAMSEAQEGKVPGFISCGCMFTFWMHDRSLEVIEPINHIAALSEVKVQGTHHRIRKSEY